MDSGRTGEPAPSVKAAEITGSDEPAAPATDAHSVAFLAYDGMTGLELGIVSEALGVPPDQHQGPWYDLRVVSGVPVRLANGVRLAIDHDLTTIGTAHTVVVPGVPDIHRDPPDGWKEALRWAHRRGARVVSICIGAFALAAAGLLDGRRAATHWRHADELSRRYPEVEVDPDVLYVDDGDILTGAGHAAGVDLCLHLVRSDFGADTANAVARRMVVPPHRSGGQAQFVRSPVTADPDDDRIAASMAWASEHLTSPITVRDLARRAEMTERTYLRRFAETTGTSPIRWLVDQRVHASLPLLESTEMPIEQVSAAVGFERPVTFRHHFGRLLRTSPSAYRRTFRGDRGTDPDGTAEPEDDR